MNAEKIGMVAGTALAAALSGAVFGALIGWLSGGSPIKGAAWGAGISALPAIAFALVPMPGATTTEEPAGQ